MIPRMYDRAEVIMDACLALADDREACRAILRERYPFDPRARPRTVQRKDKTAIDAKVEARAFWNVDRRLQVQVFARDGFINRFTGEELIAPPVLRLLSREFPSDFPHQMAWRLGEVHIAYYDLYACTNKLLPPSRGGREEAGNLVTTTMPYVLARGESTVEEAGWVLTREYYVEEWDGMSMWFVEYVDEHQELREDNYFNQWYNALRQGLRR